MILDSIFSGDLEKKLGDTELVASELANGLDKNQQDLALMKVTVFSVVYMFGNSKIMYVKP